MIDDIVGLAPSSHGTTSPLAGAGRRVRLPGVRASRKPARRSCRRSTPPPEAPGPAWYTVGHDHARRGRDAVPSQALAGDHATNVILQDRCPADPFEHVTIVDDPVALQWAINALDSPGAANPSFQPDCSGFAVVASKRLKIALGKRTAKGIRVRCSGPAGAVCIGRLVSGHRKKAFRIRTGTSKVVRFKARRVRAVLPLPGGGAQVLTRG